MFRSIVSSPTHEGRLLYAGEAPRPFWVPDARKPVATNTRPIWPMVIEKALAIHHGGYLALDHDRPELEGEVGGWRSIGVWIPHRGPDRILKIIQEALERRFVVTLGNATAQAAQLSSIRQLHAYAVLAVRSDGTGRPVLLLRNPTGEVRAPRQESAEGVGTFEMEALEALSAFRFVGITGQELTSMRTIRVAEDTH